MADQAGRRPRPSSYAGPRQSMFSSAGVGAASNSTMSTTTMQGGGGGGMMGVSSSAAKNRHLSHLHSQLAQLSANLSDLENLLRMTAVQAESMRGLGGWSGGMFMAASKVLGEEAVANYSSSASTASAAANKYNNSTTGGADMDESSAGETTTATRDDGNDDGTSE